jgi:tryptophanyl-tRNA synthetase
MMTRIFSGIQPSGELHIGNYLGAVKNWVTLQHQFESFFCVVDYHAITVPYVREDLERRTREMATGLLAAGLDPAVCTVFVQSQVPEHTELAWIFNTVTPLGELERQTQFKEKSARQEQVMAGILNYPVLQAADILLYKADVVPVGEDQVQHLELSRVTARNWNARFAADAPYFPEPQPKLTPTRRIVGLDGKAKMSKSLGAEVEENCRGAKWGCIDCKKSLHGHIVAELTPIRERAAALAATPGQVDDLLSAGAKRARTVAAATMTDVKTAMGLRLAT